MLLVYLGIPSKFYDNIQSLIEYGYIEDSIFYPSTTCDFQNDQNNSEEFICVSPTCK